MTPRVSSTGARIERLPLSRYTTLRVGGEAEIWWISSHEQLAEAISQPYRVLGGGSNLVVADEGICERVLKLIGHLAQADLEPDVQLSDTQTVVTGWIGGGTPLPGLLRKLQRLGLSNLEGTVGIPAQVGGAVWMNAGTRFGEMFDGLHTLEIVTPAGIKYKTPAELNWGYRRSGLPRGHVVTRVRLALKRSTPQDVLGRMHAADMARKGQPKMKTPGCAFKNPQGVSAGQLIDQAGLKGSRIGGAMIAQEHGNFIVNIGDASSQDILALLQLIRLRIDVPLELEYELWPAEQPQCIAHDLTNEQN